MIWFNVLGVSPELFAEIGRKLVQTSERTLVRDAFAEAGSEHRGDIGGIPLAWRNVKDGANGYYWTVALVGEGWKLRTAMSMGLPKGSRAGTPYAKIEIMTYTGPRERYIFTMDFQGDQEKMQRDMALARMFLD